MASQALDITIRSNAPMLDPGTLETALRGLWERGRAAWPDVSIDPAALAAHVRTRLGPALSASTVVRLYAEDLYLALGCAQGSEAALRAFKARWGPAIERFAREVAPRTEIAAEVCDGLMVGLLVPAGPGARARIADYSGRGPLAAWLRVASSRLALNARRAEGRRRETSDEALADRATPDDPELLVIRGRYREAFRAAFRGALAALEREQRALLKLHYLEGMTMEELAAATGGSRAGAHRRLAAARRDLFEDTCARLRAELRLEDQELQSLLRSVRSHLEVSLGGLLRESAAPSPTGR